MRQADVHWLKFYWLDKLHFTSSKKKKSEWDLHGYNHKHHLVHPSELFYISPDDKALIIKMHCKIVTGKSPVFCIIYFSLQQPKKFQNLKIYRSRVSVPHVSYRSSTRLLYYWLPLQLEGSVYSCNISRGPPGSSSLCLHLALDQVVQSGDIVQLQRRSKQ